MPNTSRATRLRAVLAPAFDNWASRAYLAAVAVSLGVFLYAVYVSSDAGFAGIWPTATTAPSASSPCWSHRRRTRPWAG